jgi:hypothetical protein
MKNKDLEKKLYLIKPHNCWYCCGGGGAIIASSSKEVSSMIKSQGDGKLYDFATKEEKQNGWDLWEVVEVLMCFETESRIIFIDYNWG